MKTHMVLAVVAATLGCAAAVSAPRVDAVKLATESEGGRISAIDLAERIERGDATLRVFDLRPESEFEDFHVASAQQASVSKLGAETIAKNASVVLYSEDGTEAGEARMLLLLRGYRSVYVLDGGLAEWIARVYEPRLAIDASDTERAEFAKAARLSRFFGGTPHLDVPRAYVPPAHKNGKPQRRVLEETGKDPRMSC